MGDTISAVEPSGAHGASLALLRTEVVDCERAIGLCEFAQEDRAHRRITSIEVTRTFFKLVVLNSSNLRKLAAQLMQSEGHPIPSQLFWRGVSKMSDTNRFLPRNSLTPTTGRGFRYPQASSAYSSRWLKHTAEVNIRTPRNARRSQTLMQNHQAEEPPYKRLQIQEGSGARRRHSSYWVAFSDSASGEAIWIRQTGVSAESWPSDWRNVGASVSRIQN